MAGPEKRYNVAEVIAEARLTKPAIILEGFPNDPSAEFRLDPPELWADQVTELAAAGKATELSRHLLGDQYEAFLAAGGGNSLVNLVLEKHSKGTTPEKSALGEASASSDS